MPLTLANAALKLNLRARRRHPAAARLPPLWLMTDAARLPDPIAALDRLPRGAGIILRHYEGGLEAPERRALAHELAARCRARGLALLVAGSGRLAAEVGADGLHLPEWLLMRGGIAGRWRRRRPDWLITASCHREAMLRAAARAGADAALVAPVFATASHPEVRPLGPLRLARMVRASPLPVFALGGIDAAAARRIGMSGAAGIAGIGAVAARRCDHA